MSYSSPIPYVMCNRGMILFSMSSSYPREQQVDVRQDRGLVEAEQPPSVQEDNLPASNNQEIALYSLSHTPVSDIPRDQPQGGSVIDPHGMVREDELFADRQALSRTRGVIWGTVHSRIFGVIWGTVGTVMIAVKIIVLLVILTREH